MDGNTVTLELGGQTRRLRYDLNAIAEIGERLGIKVRLNHLLEDLFDQTLPLSTVRTILWAGLVHENNDLTEEMVGAWVDQDNLAQVVEGFTKLFGGIGETVGLRVTEGMTGTVLPEVEEIPTEMETEVEDQIQTSTSQEPDDSP